MAYYVVLNNTIIKSFKTLNQAQKFYQTLKKQYKLKNIFIYSNKTPSRIKQPYYIKIK